MAANQSSISYPVQQLTEAVERNVKLNQNNIENGAQIQRLINKAADNLPANIKR